MLTQHIRESLQVTPGPFPDFWVGPGDEARLLADDALQCFHSWPTAPEEMARADGGGSSLCTPRAGDS